MTELSNVVNEDQLFSNISLIIEKRKSNAVSSANTHVIAMFWEVGNYINSTVLDDRRADYGKRILSTLSTKLVSRYGKSFVEANLYRMKRVQRPLFVRYFRAER